MSTFGTVIKVSLFGESHGETIGLTIHNLPANKPIDLKSIQNALDKRKPTASYHTKRQESDQFKVLSGLKDMKTTGAPFTAVIDNNDTDPSNYKDGVIRPGHADFPAFIKSEGTYDYRGGGHFSGRLTAPLIILGDIARQLLSNVSILVASHIYKIHTLQAQSFYDSSINIETLKTLQNSDFPTLNTKDKSQFINHIKAIQKEQDSVGGVVETIILNAPIGLGEPFFDSFESLLGHLLYAIPAVKGVEFGRGFALTDMKGSEANDPLTIEASQTQFTKNDMGGLLGGLSTGQPILFKTAIKPTPSISKPQKSINIKTKETLDLTIEGRHDPCIVPRALHVINALSYYTLLELVMRKEAKTWT